MLGLQNLMLHTPGLLVYIVVRVIKNTCDLITPVVNLALFFLNIVENVDKDYGGPQLANANNTYTLMKKGVNKHDSRRETRIFRFSRV